MEITPTPSRWTKVRRRAVNTFCIVAILGALAFIVPSLMGLQRYVIAGSSMQGTIDLGSIAYEMIVPVEDLKVGDIITYVPPAESGIDNLVTHRIVSIDKGTFRTKGDNNPQVDPWTFELTAATQPVYTFHVPYVGFALLALQDRTFRMVVIGIPAGLIALYSLIELVGALRRRPVAQPAVESVETPAPTNVLVRAGARH